MKLPGGEFAIVEITKIRDYCLSSTHPRGRHKARVFLSALGLTTVDSAELCDALKRASQDEDAVSGDSDEYGIRYIVDFELKRSDKAATIRSCWIVRNGETAPRFVTCFVH